MPFKNNEYEPDKPYKRKMRRLISRYLKTPMGLCKRQEFVKLSNELQFIETDFYRQTDNSNMENFAVERILIALNKLYQDRYKSTCRITEESRKATTDIAKKIWKERCKERERCPRGGIIITVGRQVALVTYKIRDCTHYGHSKGKIEFNETIQECAAREAEEELSLPHDFVYNLIRDKVPIKKVVPYTFDGLTYDVEHYYFIIDLSLEEYLRLEPNRHEIDKIELRNIDTLPCCRNCSENPLVEYNDEVEEEEHRNYFMVSCTNFRAATSLVWDIINFVDATDQNPVESNKYKEKHRNCQYRTDKIINRYY